MKHIFDIDIAKRYGTNAAVLLENIGYWIKENEANERNYFDGTYWTHNSRRAYSELFPYMSERQINTAFQKLIDDGVLITGNYNKLAYDRTLWYALTQKGKCILHFDGMETTEMSNGDNQNVKPIPDINTSYKPSIKTDKKERKKDTAQNAASYDEILSEIENDNLRETYLDFIKMRQLKKSPMTDRALKSLIKRVNELAPNNIDRQIKVLEQSILNNWQGVFPLKDENGVKDSAGIENDSKPRYQIGTLL